MEFELDARRGPPEITVRDAGPEIPRQRPPMTLFANVVSCRALLEVWLEERHPAHLESALVALQTAVELALAAESGGKRVPVTGRQRGDAPDIAHPVFAIEVKARRRLPTWLHGAMVQAIAAQRGGLPRDFRPDSGRNSSFFAFSSACRISARRCRLCSKLSRSSRAEVSVPTRDRKSTTGGRPKGCTPGSIRDVERGQMPVVILHQTGTRHGDDLVMVRLGDWCDWFGALPRHDGEGAP